MNGQQYVYFVVFQYSQKIGDEFFSGTSNCLLAFDSKLGTNPDEYVVMFKSVLEHVKKSFPLTQGITVTWFNLMGTRAKPVEG